MDMYKMYQYNTTSKNKNYPLIDNTESIVEDYAQWAKRQLKYNEKIKHLSAVDLLVNDLYKNNINIKTDRKNEILYFNSFSINDVRNMLEKIENYAKVYGLRLKISMYEVNLDPFTECIIPRYRITAVVECDW